MDTCGLASSYHQKNWAYFDLKNHYRAFKWLIMTHSPILTSTSMPLKKITRLHNNLLQIIIQDPPQTKARGPQFETPCFWSIKRELGEHTTVLYKINTPDTLSHNQGYLRHFRNVTKWIVSMLSTECVLVDIISKASNVQKCSWKWSRHLYNTKEWLLCGLSVLNYEHSIF